MEEAQRPIQKSSPSTPDQQPSTADIKEKERDKRKEEIKSCGDKQEERNGNEWMEIERKNRERKKGGRDSKEEKNKNG